MNASCALQHFCDIHGPQILLCTEAKTYIQDLNDNDDEDLKTFYSQYIKSEHPQGKVECKSCTLSSDNILVSSIDSVNHMLYISSSSTPNQELFKDVRNACLRSLNVEKSVEVDAPILFGDDENGYCISLAFSCKDFHARGSQRLYALCYLCNDKYHLISLMKLVSDCLRQAAHWLQYDANETYEQEGRIKVNTNLNGISTIATYIFRPPPTVPSQRMLSDIVHDSTITFRIHALFVWLLRITNSAIKETLFDALPTEEQTTKQERKDVFDDENSTNITTKRRRTTIISKSVTNGNQNSLIMSSTLTNNGENQSYLATSLYSTTGSYQGNDNIFYNDDDDFDSLQYQFSSNSHEAFKLFQLFIKKLNNTKYLQYVLYNWVIGNRLIIKYTNRTENKDLIRCLASVFRLFLPDGCFHLIEVTNQIAPCTANLILFDTDLVLTNNILLSITEDFNDNNSIIIKIILDDIDENLRVVKLETLPPTRSEIPVPTYVKTIIHLLTDDSLDEEAFESMITHYKIKYLNKAKLYFQLGRCQTATTVSSNDRGQMTIFNVENTSDLALIRFWQKGLSQAYRTQIRILKQDDNQRKKTDKS
ncbi:unnamed protein product [Rotaria sordida]|uniref:Folliculin n=1 Tax=Rotaria sordida TaxID=392033 RepID=A0A815GZ38_9BILA|nr:unnamed protein product [Rotaria sordida]CAF1344825.1 unnamed protein product [Rotaria sordida]